MTLFLTSLAQVLPLFVLILLGLFLRRGGVIDDAFVSGASRLVFRIALPVMVFRRLSQIDSIPAELFAGIGLFAAVTLLVFVSLWIFLRRIPGPQWAAAIQGAFRSNIAIIGLAVIENSYGPRALALGAVVLAAIMPLYNLLAITVLSHGAHRNEGSLWLKVAREVSTNPLLWAVAAGIFASLVSLPLPTGAQQVLDYLSRLTLPLALISIGASLSVKGLVHRRGLWALASAVKLVVIPALVYAGGLLTGIDGDLLRVLVLTSGCPTAVASFVMARAMGADSELAGEIISVTTLLSVLTLTGWISIVA